jgi:hypothetical protein
MIMHPANLGVGVRGREGMGGVLVITGAEDRPLLIGLLGIVSKLLGSPYRSGRVRHWVKVKNPNAPAVKREAEEDRAK